ncbi:PEP-CTERM domain protein [Oopsacas minuta]|uniref:PEP-CTERM domain protein n=1 Tax=Oopsacas minuta TaxID=111878 RepID=A0AAV7KJQ3_9METZ|nr:PEP-CTERM domain protein [Oopsacas minuta]
MATSNPIEPEPVKNNLQRVRTGIDYTSKIQPLVSVCKKDNGNAELKWLSCVALDDKTGDIYVLDCYNLCVKVFDSTANYMFKFGDRRGEGKIIGKQGKGKLEFNYPWGIAINESNNDIYICDSINNRVQILSQDFQFKSQFGSFKYPHDVKLSNEYIYVSDKSNPCIHLFNHNHILLKSVISLGQGNQVINPKSFFIDNSNNILIADYFSKSISIFNPEFQSIDHIPISEHPFAVTVDNHDRVIVVCNHNVNCLQIF